MKALGWSSAILLATCGILWVKYNNSRSLSLLQNGTSMIIKQGQKFVLKSKDGSKVLGKFDTKEQALKREKQINFFKHLDKRKK